MSINIDHNVLPCSKLLRQIETAVTDQLALESQRGVECKDPIHLWVLVLSGSFNPVHSSHVLSFEAARKAVEGTLTDHKVVGGFLCPSSDKYISGKLGNEGMKLTHRAAMCSLALEKSEWLDVMSYGSASGSFTTEFIHQSLQSLVLKNRFRESLSFSHQDMQTASELYESLLKPIAHRIVLKSVEICGLDHAGKYQLWRAKPMVCLARVGYEQYIKAYEKDKRSDYCLKDFIMVKEANLPEISSTEIRNLFAQGAAGLRTLVDRGWCTENVATYLRKTGSELFLRPHANLATDQWRTVTDDFESEDL